MTPEEFDKELCNVFAEYKEVVHNFNVNISKSIELLDKFKGKIARCRK